MGLGKGKYSFVVNGRQTVEASIEISVKVPEQLEIDIPFDQVYYYQPYTKRLCLTTEMFIHPWCCFIHNNQEVETTYISINGIMIMWYIYLMEYLSVKKSEIFK